MNSYFSQLLSPFFETIKSLLIFEVLLQASSNTPLLAYITSIGRYGNPYNSFQFGQSSLLYRTHRIAALRTTYQSQPIPLYVQLVVAIHKYHHISPFRSTNCADSYFTDIIDSGCLHTFWSHSTDTIPHIVTVGTLRSWLCTVQLRIDIDKFLASFSIQICQEISDFGLGLNMSY